MEKENHIQKAIDIVGHYKLAKACGVSGAALYKWINANRLPRTEWTKETNYAEIIERETQGAVKKRDLLRI